jgi:hypothetical protein
MIYKTLHRKLKIDDWLPGTHYIEN